MLTSEWYFYHRELAATTIPADVWIVFTFNCKQKMEVLSDMIFMEGWICLWQVYRWSRWDQYCNESRWCWWTIISDCVGRLVFMLVFFFYFGSTMITFFFVLINCDRVCFLVCLDLHFRSRFFFFWPSMIYNDCVYSFCCLDQLWLHLFVGMFGFTILIAFFLFFWPSMTVMVRWYLSWYLCFFLRVFFFYQLWLC